MNSCSMCRTTQQNHYFSFAENQTTFYDAKQQCISRGGTLAVNLTQEEYRLFKRCCASTMKYWIGLIDNNICRSSRKPYQWIGSTNCRSARPLQMIVEQRNPNQCQAVTITLDISNSELPLAARINCNSRKSYVCRFSIPRDEASSPVLNQRTTLNNDLAAVDKAMLGNVYRKRTKSNTNRTTSYTFQSDTFKNNSNESKNESHLFFTPEQFTVHNTITSSPKFISPFTSSDSAGSSSVVGGVLGFFIILLLSIVMFTCCWRIKKRRSFNLNRAKVRQFFTKSRSSDQKMENIHIYSSNPNLVASYGSAPIPPDLKQVERTQSGGSTYVAANFHPEYLSVDDVVPYVKVSENNPKRLRQKTKRQVPDKRTEEQVYFTTLK